MLEVITRMLCVFCCLLIVVLGRENHTVNVPLNSAGTINCTDTSVINILNITVKENSQCTSKKCRFVEDEKIKTKDSCDGHQTCNITSNIPNSCLLGLGYSNLSYTCEVFVHSCNFGHNWCEWLRSPSGSGFRWKRTRYYTSTPQTGPSGDHTTSSGYYLYTEASNGNSDDVAVLQSVRITSSPHQCLSFWYNMYGSNIGTLRVHQLYSTEVQQTPIWSMSGNKGREWRYQAINLTYQNDNYRILFEGVRGDGRKGDIAVDDIHISNTDCKDKGKICDSPDSDQCQMTSGTNNQHSIKNIEKCKEEDEPLNLSSCSKKYLTVDNLRFDPEFKFDTCTDTYALAKQSVCMNTNDASICTVDLHGFIKSNPDCFRRYSMIIDYACEEILTPVSRSQQTSDTGIAVGVSIGCGIIASIIIIIIYYIRRSDRNKKASTIHQQNRYQGNQGIALTQKTNTRSDHNELIGGVTQEQHYYNSTAPSKVKDDDYSYTNVDIINNPPYKHATINEKNENNSLNKFNQINETGLNRQHGQGNPIDETSKISLVLKGNANENRLGKNTNNQKANQYETEGTYDTAGTSLYKDNTNTIYNHTVDDVYDTSSHKREGGEGEDTYDHVPGRKTNDDYDIIKCT